MVIQTDFTDLLDEGTSPIREAHLSKGLAYLALAEVMMATQIKKGGGSVNPPHALAFARVHLLAAQVIAEVEG